MRRMVLSFGQDSVKQLSRRAEHEARGASRADGDARNSPCKPYPNHMVPGTQCKLLWRALENGFVPLACGRLVAREHFRP